jgi:sulfate transport system ATP-binding protein
VFVTHDQEEALELADRVVIMNRGVIEQIGTPREVYDMPATPFVSEFVGETNRIPVTVADGRVLHHGQALDVSPKALANGPAELHFRPHEALLGDDTPGALPIVVGAVHKRGGTWRVEARVDVALVRGFASTMFRFFRLRSRGAGPTGLGRPGS